LQGGYFKGSVGVGGVRIPFNVQIPNSGRRMNTSFRQALESLVNARIAEGADPQELFEELSREANLVFGHYNLEYEMGLFAKTDKQE